MQGTTSGVRGSPRESRTFPARRDLVIAGGLFLLVAIVFGASVGYGFIPYDDDTYLLENPAIRRGLDSVSLRWSLGFQSGYQYYPLTWISHALDFSLFGDDPAGPHAVNVALHALSTALLFLFFSGTTGERGASAVAAALFGVHPLRVESVVWISERKDVLSVFLAVLLLLAYASWSERPTPARRVGLALIFLAGLLAKPMLVTLPVLLLIVDVWPLRRLAPGGDRLRTFGRLVVEKLPLFGLSALAAAVAVLSQHAAGAISPIGTSPLSERIALVLNAVFWYVWKTFLPQGLSFFYPIRMLTAAEIAAGAATAALLTGVALFPRVPPAVRAGVAWYLVALAPVSGFVRLGGRLVADRYSYLPSIGLVAAVVFGLRSLLPAGRKHVLAAVAAGSTVVVASFAIATSLEAGRFRDGLTLFSSAVETDPANWLAQTKLGDELVSRGRTAEAVGHYAEAFRVWPDWDGAAGNLAQALAATGRGAEAVRTLEAGLARNPDSEWLHRVAASVYERYGNPARAAQLLSRADALRALGRPKGASPAWDYSIRRARGADGR